MPTNTDPLTTDNEWRLLTRGRLPDAEITALTIAVFAGIRHRDTTSTAPSPRRPTWSAAAGWGGGGWQPPVARR